MSRHVVLKNYLKKRIIYEQFKNAIFFLAEMKSFRSIAFWILPLGRGRISLCSFTFRSIRVHSFSFSNNQKGGTE